MDKVLNYIKDCLQHQEGKFQIQMTWWAIWGDPRYQDPIMCHKWGYTIDLMKALLGKAGFSRAQFTAPRYHIRQRDMRVVCYP
jgi:hypothetical protein